MIEFINVTKKNTEKDNYVLQNINLVIGKGEFVYLTGPNGAGKSTLIKMIYREKRPTSGHVLVNRKNVSKMGNYEVPALRRNIGVVFQELKLFKNRSTFKNIAFPLEVTGVNDEEINKRVKEMLKFIGLLEKSEHSVSRLSTGEKQRVAIARAIVNNPEIIICDEITKNLTPETTGGIMKLLMELNQLGTTVIFVTHDRRIIDNFPKRTIRIEKGAIINDNQY